MHEIISHFGEIRLPKKYEINSHFLAKNKLNILHEVRRFALQENTLFCREK